MAQTLDLGHKQNIDIHYIANMHLQKYFTIKSEFLDCLFCKQQLDYGDLDPHIKSHNLKSPFSCIKCNSTWPSINHLIMHLHTHFQFNPFLCRICDKSYKFKKNIINHLRDIHGITYQCPYCGDTFITLREVKNHLPSHTSNKNKLNCNKTAAPHANFTVQANQRPVDDDNQDVDKFCTNEKSSELQKEQCPNIKDIYISAESCYKKETRSCGQVSSCFVCKEEVYQPLLINEENDIANKRPRQNTDHISVNICTKLNECDGNILQIKYSLSNTIEKSIQRTPKSSECCTLPVLHDKIKILVGDKRGDFSYDPNVKKSVDEVNTQERSLSAHENQAVPIDPTMKGNIQIIRGGFLESKHDRPDMSTNDSVSYVATLDQLKYDALVNEKFVECPFCQLKLQCNYMKIHIKTHTHESPLSCMLCEISLQKQTDVIEHLLTHFQLQPFACLVCEETFNSKQKIVIHLRNNHNIYYKLPVFKEEFWSNKGKKISLCSKSPEIQSCQPAVTIDSFLNENLLCVDDREKEKDGFDISDKARKSLFEYNQYIHYETEFLSKESICTTDRSNVNIKGLHEEVLSFIDHKDVFCDKGFKEHLPLHFQEMREFVNEQITETNKNEFDTNKDFHDKIHSPEHEASQSLCQEQKVPEHSLKSHVNTDDNGEDSNVHDLAIQKGISLTITNTDLLAILQLQNYYSVNSNFLKCPFCKKKFSFEGMEIHIKIHEFSFPYSCLECGTELQSLLRLVDHIMGHFNGRHFTCSMCKKTFIYRRDVVRHLKKVHGIRITCPYCRKEFMGTFTAKKHIFAQCEALKKFNTNINSSETCQRTNQIFEDENSKETTASQNHTIFSHEVDFKDVFCDRIEIENHNLEYYKNEKHQFENMIKDQIQLVEMDISREKVNNPINKFIDIMLSNDQQASCSLFGEEQEDNKPLATAGSSLETNFPEQGLLINTSLKNGNIHRLATLQLQKYYTVRNFEQLKCPLCKKNIRYGDIKAHIETHTFSKGLSCRLCKLKCPYTYDLKRHLLLHLQCRPYLCNTCKTTFKCKNQIIKHLKYDHNIPYGCSFCGKEFRMYSTVQKHIRKHLRKVKNLNLDFCLSEAPGHSCLKKNQFQKHNRDQLSGKFCKDGNATKISVTQNPQDSKNEKLISLESNLCNSETTILQKGLVQHEEVLYCFVCRGTFNDVKHLDKHLELHLEEHHITMENDHVHCSQEDNLLNTSKECLMSSQQKIHPHSSTNKINDVSNSLLSHERILRSKKSNTAILFECRDVNSSESSQKKIEKVPKISSENTYINKEINSLQDTRKDPDNNHLDVQVLEGNIHHLAKLHIQKYYTVLNSEVLNCPFCKLEFSYVDMRVHLKTHGFKVPPSCKDCKIVKGKTSMLVDHIMTHFDCKPFMCLKCNKSFKYKWAIMKHLKEIHCISYQCPICEENFNTYERVKLHIALHAQGMDSVDADTNELGAPSKTPVNKNRVTINRDKHAEVLLRQKAQLQKGTHKETIHLSTKDYSCKENEMPMISSTLEKHIYNCFICKEIFYDNIMFTNHLEMHMNEDHHLQGESCMELVDKNEKKYKGSTSENKQQAKYCFSETSDSVCNVVSKSSRNLMSLPSYSVKKICLEKKSDLSNSNVSLFPYDQDRQYMNQLLVTEENTCNFLLSENIHNDELTKISDDIGQSVQMNSHYPVMNLTQYYVITEPDSFICSVCKQTIKYENMQKHIRTHGFEYPVTCMKCNIQHHDKDTLVTHIMMHNSFKLFLCVICGNTFKNRKYVLQHLNTIHEMQYDCSVCEQKFSYYNDICKHIHLFIHSEIPNDDEKCLLPTKSQETNAWLVRYDNSNSEGRRGLENMFPQNGGYAECSKLSDKNYKILDILPIWSAGQGSNYKKSRYSEDFSDVEVEELPIKDDPNIGITDDYRTTLTLDTKSNNNQIFFENTLSNHDEILLLEKNTNSITGFQNEKSAYFKTLSLWIEQENNSIRYQETRQSQEKWILDGNDEQYITALQLEKLAVHDWMRMMQLPL